MCFTPRVSLATALIEFLTAIFIWLTLKRNLALKVLVLFLYALGLYQFAEAMMCVTGDTWLWSRVGFIGYNALPALWLHFAAEYTGRSFSRVLMYIPMFAAVAVAVFYPNFLVDFGCYKWAVRASTVFSLEVGNKALAFPYYLYYFTYILLALAMFLRAFYNEKNSNDKRKFCFWMFILTLASLMPAFILVIVVPDFMNQFPSIYCQFAILFALATIYFAHKHPTFLQK